MSLPPYDQSMRDFERHYQVVLPDSVGQAALGFRDGNWFRLNSGTPHAVPIRSAIIICPHAAGSIVQIVCWWMRENTRSPRALDLATELALTVGELARKAIEDDPLGMSISTMSTVAPAPAPAPVTSSFASAPYSSAAPYSAAAPYQSGSAYPDSGAYAGSSYLSAGSPMAAATTVLPQINPDQPMPGHGMPNPGFGAPVGGMPRPSGPAPSIPALPTGPSRGPQGGPGASYPGGQYSGRPGPAGGQPGGPGRYAGPDGRPAAPPPQQRRPAPYDSEQPPRQDPGRGEMFRDGAPPPRRAAPYGQQPEQEWSGDRSGEYAPRPPQRPRNDPNRAW